MQKQDTPRADETEVSRFETLLAITVDGLVIGLVVLTFALLVRLARLAW